MNWSSADTLLAEVPLTGGETILATMAAPGMGQATLAPMCLPYSPEYLPQKPGRGVAALEQLAKATGGCERSNLADVWKDIPKKRALPVAGPVSAAGGRGRVPAGSDAAAHGTAVGSLENAAAAAAQGGLNNAPPDRHHPPGQTQEQGAGGPAAPQPARAAAEPSPEQAESDNEPMAAA